MQTSPITVRGMSHWGWEGQRTPQCRSCKANLTRKRNLSLWTGTFIWVETAALCKLTLKNLRKSILQLFTGQELSYCSSYHVFDIKLWESHVIKFKYPIYINFFWFVSSTFWLKLVATVIEVHCWSCFFHMKVPIMSGKQMEEKSCLIESKYLEQFQQSFGWELI